MLRGSSPISIGAKSSTAPTTARVFHSSDASPHPNSPAWSVTTLTKTQFRISALTTTVLTSVIFIEKAQGQDGCPTFAPAYSGFPVELDGSRELNAAFLNESRTREYWWRPVQEI